MLDLKRFFRGKGSRPASDGLVEAVTAATPEPSTDELVASVVELLQQGRASDATDVVHAALTRRPDVARLHLLSGNLLLYEGRADGALAAFGRALTFEPALAEAHFNGGLALERLGRVDEALTAYRSAANSRGDYLAAVAAVARLLQEGGHREAALPFLNRVTELSPASADAWFSLATALLELRRPDDALSALDRCIALDPAMTRAHSNRAAALSALNRPNEALASADHALQIDPSYANAALNKATLLLSMNRPADAVTCCRLALGFASEHPGLLNCMGIAQQELRQPEHALAAFSKALAKDPAFAAARINRALARTSLNDLSGALADLDAIPSGSPQEPEACANRGSVFQEQGRHREALIWFEKACRLLPDFAEAHVNAGVSHLSLGEFNAGWAGYEWRWQSKSWVNGQRAYANRAFQRPAWLGEEVIVGKTVYLHFEQGLGDTLQFCRYATHMARQGASVILEVQRPLLTLLRELEGVEQLIAEGDPVPKHDLRSPLMSLSLAHGTKLESIPVAEPYLGRSTAHGLRTTRWAERLGSFAGPRVGLVWSGNAEHRNDRNRSIPFSAFADILIDGIEFIIMQNEIRDTDQAALREPRLRFFGPELSDFAETAALAANLDLVICIDSSVAHLVGAMGKTTWLLLPANPDFRWMTEREDSPWYASIRLFRQLKLDGWGEVLTRVKTALAARFAPAEVR